MPDILYEDNHVLVAVKPPNMLSQADSTGDTDILTVLKEYIREKYHKPGNVYLGLVHRLDRPVGGLMVFARTSKAASRLSAQMRVHDMGRQYLCVVRGEAEDTFTLTDYLIKDEIRNKTVVCEADEKGAKLAVLHGRCVDRREGTSLCVIRLETGRGHQIRVQLSHAGLPLWGDNRYGDGIPGQQIALWGYKLAFTHPTTHEKLVFHAMPEGGIWSLYADLLTVPEDTDDRRKPVQLTLTDEVVRKLESFTWRGMKDPEKLPEEEDADLSRWQEKDADKEEEKEAEKKTADKKETPEQESQE